MKAEQVLKKIEDIDTKIECRAFDIVQLKLVASGRTSQWGSERVQSSGSQDKMANAIVKYIDLEDEDDPEMRELLRLKQEIINIIKKLEPKHFKMLHRIYVQRMTIREIHLMERMSRTWADNLHNKAKEELQDVLDNMEEGELNVFKNKLLRI